MSSTRFPGLAIGQSRFRGKGQWRLATTVDSIRTRGGLQLAAVRGL